MSNVQWPELGGFVLEHQYGGREIPCKVLDNGNYYVELSSDFEIVLQALAFISHQIVNTTASTLLVTWITDWFKRTKPEYPNIQFAVELESADGSTKRLEAKVCTADEAEQLIRSIKD